MHTRRQPPQKGLLTASPLRTKVDAATTRVLHDTHIRDEELKRQLRQLLEECTDEKVGPRERRLPSSLIEELSRAHNQSRERLVQFRNHIQTLLLERPRITVPMEEDAASSREGGDHTPKLGMTSGSRSPMVRSMSASMERTGGGSPQHQHFHPLPPQSPVISFQSNSASSSSAVVMKEVDQGSPGLDEGKDVPSSTSAVRSRLIRKTLAHAVGEGIGTLTKKSKLHEYGTPAEHQRAANNLELPVDIRVDELMQAIECLKPVENVISRLGDMIFANPLAYHYAAVHTNDTTLNTLTNNQSILPVPDPTCLPPPTPSRQLMQDEKGEGVDEQGWALRDYEEDATTNPEVEANPVVHYDTIGGPSGSASRVAYLERRLLERDAQLDFLRAKLNRRAEILGHIRSTLLKEQLVLKARQLGPYEIPGFSFFNIVDVVENAEEFEIATSALRDEFESAKRAQEKLVDQLQSDGAAKRFQLIKAHDEEAEKQRRDAARLQESLEEAVRVSNQRADDIQTATDAEKEALLAQLTALMKEAKDQTRRINHLNKRNQQLEGKKSSSILDPPSRRASAATGAPSVTVQPTRTRVASTASVVFAKSPTKTGGGSSRRALDGEDTNFGEVDAMIVSQNSFSMGGGDDSDYGSVRDRTPSPKRTVRRKEAGGGGGDINNNTTTTDNTKSSPISTSSPSHNAADGSRHYRHPSGGGHGVSCEDKGTQSDFLPAGGSYLGMPPLHGGVSRAPSGFTAAPTPSERSLARSISPGGMTRGPGNMHSSDHGSNLQDTLNQVDDLHSTVNTLTHQNDGADGVPGNGDKDHDMSSDLVPEGDGVVVDPATNMGLEGLDAESLPDETLSRVGSFLGNDLDGFDGLDGINTGDGGVPLGLDGRPLATRPTMCFVGLILDTLDAADNLVNEINHSVGGQCIIRPFELGPSTTSTSFQRRSTTSTLATDISTQLSTQFSSTTSLNHNTGSSLVCVLAAFHTQSQATKAVCVPRSGLICGATLKPSPYELRAFADGGDTLEGSSSTFSREFGGGGQFSVMVTGPRVDTDLPSLLNVALRHSHESNTTTICCEDSTPSVLTSLLPTTLADTGASVMASGPKTVSLSRPEGAEEIPVTFVQLGATVSSSSSLGEVGRSSVVDTTTIPPLSNLHTQVLGLSAAPTCSIPGLNSLFAGASNSTERARLSEETVYVVQIRTLPDRTIMVDIGGQLQTDSPRNRSSSRFGSFRKGQATGVICWAVAEVARRGVFVCSADHSQMVSLHFTAEDAAQFAVACQVHSRETLDTRRRLHHSHASSSGSPPLEPMDGTEREGGGVYAAIGASTLGGVMAGAAFETAPSGGCSFTPRWPLYEPICNTAPSYPSTMDCGVPSWQGHVVLFAAEGCSMPTLLQSVATASSRCSLVSSQVISHQSTKPRGSTTDATTSSSSVACLAPIKDVLTIHHIESTAVVLVPSGNLNVPGGGGGGFNPSKRELSVASIGGVSTASGGNLLGGSFFSLQQGEKPTASVSSSASPSLPMPPLWSLVSLRTVPFNWRPYAVGPRLGTHMYHSVTLTRGATDTVLVEHALRTSLVAITSSDIPPTYSVTSIKVPHSHPTTSSRDTPIAPLRDNHTNKGTDIFVTVALSTSLSHLHAAHTHMVSALVGQQGDSTMVSIQTTTSLVVPISFIAANQVPSPVLVSDFACVGYDDEDGVMSLPSRIQPATPLYRSVGLSLESLRIVLRDHRDDVASSIQQKDIDAKDHSPLLIYDGATPTQLPPVGIMGGTSSTSLGTTASTRQLPNSFTFLIGCGPPPSVLTAGYSSAIAIITDLNTTILSELTPLVKNMNLAAVGCRSVLVDGALVISGVVPLVSTHGWQTVLDILHTVSPSLLLLPPTRMVGAGAPMVTFLLPISTSRSFSILKARGDISVILGRLRAVCACVDLVMGPIIPYLCESVETPHQHNSMLDRFSHCLTAVATTNVLALRLTKWVSQSRRSNITFTMRALTWIEATLPGDPLLVLPVGVDNETGMPRTHNIYSRPSRLQKLDVGGSFEASLYSSEALPPEVSVNGLISTVGSLSGMGDFLCRGPPTQLDGKVTVTAMRIGSDGVLPANNGAAFLLAPHPLLSPELCRLGVIFMCHTSSSSQVVDEARGGILCSVTLDASSLHSTNMLVGSPEDGYYINHDSIPALAALHAATASSSSRPAVQERLMPLTVRTTTAVPNGHPSLTPSGAHIVLVGINLRHPHPTDFDRQLSACVGLAPLYGGTQVGGVTPQQQHDAIGEGSRSSKPITESILFYAFITLLDAFEFAIDLGSKLRYIPQALSSLHTDVQRSVLRLTTLSLIADANVSWDYTLGRLWLSPLCLERVHNEMRSVRGLTDDKGTIVEEPVLLAPSALYAALPDHHRRGTVEVNMTTTPAGSFLLRGGLLDEDTTTTPPPSVVCICRSQSIPVGGIQLQLDPTPTSPTPTNNWALAPFQRTLVGPTAVTFLLPSPSAVAELRSLLSCLLAMPVTGTRTVALGESQSTLHGDAVEVFEVDARCVAPPRSTSTTSSQSLPPPLFTLTFIMDLRTSSSEPGVGPNNNNTSYFNRKTLASHTTIPHTFCELLVSCAVRHNKCGMGAISTQSVDPVLRINAQYVSSASTVDPSSFVASTVTIDAAALVSHRAFIDGYQSELASTYYTNPASPLLVVIPSSSTQHQQEGTTVMYPHCIGIDGVDTKMSFGPMSDVGAKHLHTYLSDPSTWSNRVFQPRSGGSGSAMPSGATEFPAQLLRLRDAPLPSSFSNTPFTASADISWGGGCLVVATTHSSISLSHLLAGVYSALVPLQGQCRAIPLTRGVATNRGGSATQLSFLLVPTSSATTVISEALQLLSNHPFTTTTPSRVIFAVSAPLSQWNGDGDWRCQMMSSGGLPTLLDIPMLEAPLLDKIAQSMATTPIPTTANTDNADGESNQHVIVVEEESAQAYFGATTPYPYLPPISGVSLSYVSIGHPSSSSSTLLFEAPTETDLANTQRRDNQQLEASVSATYHTLRFKSGSTPMDAPLAVSALLTTMRLLTTVVDIVSQTASVDGTRLQWVLREPTCVVDGTLQPSLVSGRVKQISSICRSVAGLVVTHDELPSGGWLSCAGRGLEGVSVAPCLKGKEPSPTHGSVALVSASPQFWQWLRSTAPNVGGLHIRPRVPGVPSVLEVSGVGAEGGAYDWMKDLTSTLPYGCLLSVVPGTEDPSNPHPGGASLPNNHAGGGGVRGGGGEWVGVPIGVQVGGGDGVDKGVQWEDQHCIDWDMPPQSPVGGGADGDAARADGGTPGSYNPRVPSKPGAPLFGLNGGGGAMKGPAQITMHVCTADDPDELMRGGSSNAKKSTTTQHHRPGTGANRQVAIDGTWHMAPKAPRLPNHEYAKGYVRVGSARPQQPPSPRKGG